MSEPNETDEVLDQIKRVAEQLETTSKDFDAAVERFNSLAPKVERLLRRPPAPADLTEGAA
jgi:ABC-type transporter Mla subunit MlaD